MVNFTLKPMQISLALIIIRSCDYEMVIPYISEILGMSSTQALLSINYLKDYSFIARKEDGYSLTITNSGYLFLRDEGLEKVTLNDLLNLEERDNFNYKSKLLKYIPQKIRK